MDRLQKKVKYDDSEERGYYNLAQNRYGEEDGSPENGEDEVKFFYAIMNIYLEERMLKIFLFKNSKLRIFTN